MMNLRDLVEVAEGEVRILLPEYREFRGPGSSEMPVFYNPTMRIDRDLLVRVVKFYAEEGWVFLDGLAASGIRALRVGRESGKNLKLHACDLNPLAVQVMKRNSELNDLELEVHERDLNSLIPELRPNFADIDAFGTPVPFLDVAIQYVRHKGIIAITSTDTSPLVGTHPKVCLRRYLARSLRTPQKHEVAVRILLGYIARTAAKYDRGIQPILSYRGKHFYRIYFRVLDGIKRAEDSLRKLVYLNPRSFESFRVSSYPYWLNHELIGPLWSGPLEDDEFLRFALRDLNESSPETSSEDTRRLVRLLVNENISFLFFELPWECRNLKISIPPLKVIEREVRAKGYRFGRTHFSDQGVKTDMDRGSFRNLLLTLSGKSSD